MVVDVKVSQLRSNPRAYLHAKVRLAGLMTFGRKLQQGYWLTLYDGTGYILVWSNDSFEGYCTVEGSLYQSYVIAASVTKSERPEEEFDMRKYEIPAEIVVSCGLLAGLGVYTNLLAFPEKLASVIDIVKYTLPLAIFLAVMASHIFIAELDRLILKMKLHKELWKIYLPLMLFAIIAVFNAPSTVFISTKLAIAASQKALMYASIALLLTPLVHAYVLWENGVDRQRALLFGILNPLIFFVLFAIGVFGGGFV